MIDLLTGIDAAHFGIYIHFPYCLSKCPYCDFASNVAKEIPGERYAHAVRTELDLRLAMRAAPLRPAESVFFGGGTPSLWEPKWVGGILRTLAEQVTFEENAEITLEANPGAADAAHFAQLRDAGINRLSIGVQSFRAETLKALGRGHDGDAARFAYRRAREAGFQNVSMDFIYGVHGQSLDEALADAEEAASLQPEHLSAYALTLEREVMAEEVPLARQLARGEIALPPDERVLEMASAIGEAYGRHGLRRYEISNYAQPGFHSRHNCSYWTGGEYLALGVGATGYFREGTGGIRYSNVRSPEKYFAALEAGELPEAGRETLSRHALFLERLSMGLRLSSGIRLEETCRAFDEEWGPRAAVVDRLVRDGFLQQQDDFVSLTSRGFEMHSAICAELF